MLEVFGMNKKLLTPLFVAASFLLIGCSTSEIVGRPSWINEDIVIDPTGLKDNKMKEIYDAIKKLEKAKIKHDLLKYCELDTFAMVKVWQELVRVSK